jgi:hypothetical protein
MAILPMITLALTPWHGPSLPTAVPNATKYKLSVHGTPYQAVPLRAEGLPQGWVASFCTQSFCSPFHYTLTLSSRGSGWIEFVLIRTDDSAPKHAGVTIRSVGAQEIHVAI